MRNMARRTSRLIVAIVLLATVFGTMPALASSVNEANSQTGADGELHTLSPQADGEVAATITYIDGFGGREPQLVIGPDTRIQIEDTTRDPYKKIVHLIAINEAAGIGKRCTGTFIGERVIMTAAHCLWSPDLNGWPDTVEVIPARNGDQAPYGSVIADTIWVPQGWIDSLSDGDLIPEWETDYGLVVLSDGNLGATLGTMTIGVLDDATLAASDFTPTTAGYPGDKPIGTMWLGTQSSFSGVTPTHLFHEIDSWQGASGSAVWRASDELIVGIESLETESENVALRITQTVVDDFQAVCEYLDCAFNVSDGDDSPPMPPPGNGQPPVARPSDPAFQSTWDRTDRPVADGQATRTWMWGPQPNSQVVWETYDQAPGGQRAVQYYDKSRMEITNPGGDANSIWYVTNGLLATELITGRMQLGDDRFEEHAPANVNLAGDAGDPNGPTYATFSTLLDLNPQPVGMVITQRVNRAGQVADEVALAEQGVVIGYVDNVTSHSIAEPFWTFMNSSGMVYQNGALTTAPLFENAFFATGRPITEPYWTNVLVGGTPRLVLVQCFERRCLTYTPDNAPEWRVEMGNIGQHYYAWRYLEDDDQPMAPLDTCLDAVEAEFLTLLNDYRDSVGLDALSNSAVLNKASYDHSLDMGERAYFDHFTPEGLSPQDRVEAAGYSGNVAENLAAGSGSAIEILEIFQQSSETEDILRSPTLVVGIGRVFVEDSPWDWYWTVEFGDQTDDAPIGCG